MEVIFVKNIQPLNKLQKICGIDWSQNNMKLAIACEDKNIYLFDEEGNVKEYFPTNSSKSVNYEIKQILFNSSGDNLAVSQSDDIIYIYHLGLNWGEPKTIINKYEIIENNCMIWSKTNPKEIIFGTSNGKIILGLLDENNTIKELYNHKSSCISLSSSLDGNYILSGHKNYSIFIYNRKISDLKKLVEHSSIPTCLVWLIDSRILVAGNDSKVVIYDINGQNVQAFDCSNEAKEFICYNAISSGDAIALGNKNLFHIFLFNELKHNWEKIIKKLDKECLITNICWKPDRSALVLGNSLNSVDMYDIYLSNKIFNNDNKNNNNEIFEVTCLINNYYKIKNKQTQKYMILQSKDFSKLFTFAFDSNNYFVLSKKTIIILGDLNKGIYSEIPWERKINETYKIYNFQNCFFCIICNNEGLYLIEFCKNKILFSQKTNAYTEEDIEKLKNKYNKYLSDIKEEIESYIKERDFSKAINIFEEKYNQTNYDKNILEKLIKNLNNLGMLEESGDLLAKLEINERALRYYKKAKIFEKAIKIAKKINDKEINKIYERWGDYLLEQKNYEKAINIFIQAGALEKAAKISILLNKWEEALDLVNNCQIITNPEIFIKIGKHYEEINKFDKAEEYYIKGGELMHLFNFYIKLSEKIKKEKADEIKAIIESLKIFFEEKEKNIKLEQQKKKILNEEEINIIKEKFNELKNILFNNKKRKDENYMLKNDEINHIIIFKKIMEGNINKNEINEEIIYNLIDYGESVAELEKILKLCNDFLQLLKFIASKFDFILNIYKKEKKYINIDENFTEIEYNSLESVMVFHELILDEEKKNNYYLINFEKIIEKHIEYFKDKDIDNLILLKEMIYNQNKYGQESKNLNKKINNTIKNVINILIDNKSLNSREIIDLILKVGIEMFENKEKELFNSINIYELKENEYIHFIKLWNLINNKKDKKNELIKIIFNKIQVFKDFGLIYKLIPENNFDNNIAKNLDSKFKTLFNSSFNIKICINVVDDIFKTLKIFISLNYNIKDFLKFINDNHILSIKIKSELYLRVIHDMKLNQNEELIKSALIYLIENNITNNLNEIYSIIITIIGINNENISKELLKVIEKFIIKEDDIFNPDKLNNFQLYTIIYQQFFYKYESYKYFKESNNSLNQIYKKIMGIDLSYKKFIKLIEQIDNENFQEKLTVFNFLINQSNIKKMIYDWLKLNKEKYQNLMNNLNKYKNFLSNFFDVQEKNCLIEIKEEQINISQSKNMGETLLIMESFLEGSNYKKYKDFLNLVNSKFFNALYYNNKNQGNNENQENLFNNSLQDFLSLNILININLNYPIDNIPLKEIIIKEIKEIINISIKTKNSEEYLLNEIKNELDILKEISNLNLNNLQDNNIYIKKKIYKRELFDPYTPESKLIYLSYLDNIKKIIDSLIFLIDITKVDKTYFYKELSKEKNEIENNNKICLKDITKYLDFLKKLKGIELDITEQNNCFIQFLNILTDNQEGIKFLIERNVHEIRQLSEFKLESDNSTIQISDILDLINICNFFENIKILTKKNDDIELIQEFKVAFITTPSFFVSFTNYFIIFKEIKNLYEEYLEGSEVSRNKIEQILKFSIINIKFDNETRNIKIIGSYYDKYNQTREFYYNDLEELYERALLFCGQIFDNIAQDTVENIGEKKKNFETFVNFIENLSQLINYLNSLYIKGYPYYLEIVIQIEKNIISSEEKDLNELLTYYKRLSEDLENAQTEAYSKKSLIRLIYGNQFYDLCNYLFNKKGDINSLLKRVSNNKIKKIPKFDFNNNNLDFDDNEKKFKNIIGNINDFLLKCLEFNEIKLIDLFKENIIKESFNKKLNNKIYTWLDSVKLDIDIINFYKIITGNFPLPITILICTKETNEEEITSFIYRTIFCEFRVLFTIMNSDNLEESKAQYLLWIIDSLYTRYKKKINSVLLITFTDENSILRKELKNLKGHKYFNPDEYINNNKINNNNEINNQNNNNNNNNINNNNNLIEVWSSDATGVGKTTQIKLEAEKTNKKYIYFPIGGVISRKDLIKRIMDLDINKMNKEKIYLHIDIYDSNEETTLIIKEFLFSLLITRCYSYEGKIFYLYQGIKIAIEIPIGFYDMKNKFALLEYFSSKKIYLNNLPPLIDFEEKNKNNNNNNNNNINNNMTHIQLVSSILIMLENGTIIDEILDLDKKHKKIPINDCEKIINKYFFLKLPKGNYYQKNAFIHILADQFRLFCKSSYLNPEVLYQNGRAKFYKKHNITKVREIMIKNLIDLTLYFVKGPFTKIILNQEKAMSQIFGEFNQDKINDIANIYLSKMEEEIISFEKIKPSLVFFNEDIESFSIITTSKEGEEEYEQLLRLYNSQNYKIKDIPLIDYRSLTHEELLSEVKNVLNLNVLSIEKIREIIGAYCFTSDNFIKMILILLRIRAGIPVIMMGETGCGKTSLIKILANLLNRGKKNLKIMNIHAGIKDKDIIDFIEKVNNEINSGINENQNNNNNNNKTYTDKIWVFFDEINTCNSMGLLSEIFYNHSYYGKKLNNKLTFIAACNPYRLRPIKKIDNEENDFCLTLKDKKFTYNAKHNLVYLVNPLPHSLLTSIFDFGHLSSKDEKKYIENIVKEILGKYNTKKEIEELFVNEIVECQNFVRENNDICSVSLRDLRRFNLLFDFFMKYLAQNKEKNNENDINKILINSMCLSLYFCYYIRLSNNKLRKELIKKINNKLQNLISFEKVTQNEKNFLMSKMKIPIGIAKNSTLKDNIFSLFICIINQIPLFICGKPGTSKSLSFQILYDNMKGKRSDNDFFKNYPEIFIIPYQGSKTSTSEGVQKVFNKAKNFYKKKKENKNEINIKQLIEEEDNNDNNIKNSIIPVIYFDEMGLAEESPHNPLKVFHSELEYNDKEQNYRFVGISNWKLDASKMNRAIFLGVPNLGLDDLKETANEIVLNIDKNIYKKYEEFFNNLVATYWEYKKFTQNKNQREFHGLRDFYHLIKNATFYLINLEKENEKNKEELNLIEKTYQIGIKSLYRNFDGLKEPFNSYEEVKKIFNKFYPNFYLKNPNFFECLKDNINDNNSRFLLIITKSSMSIHLLKDLMQKLQKKYVFYNGSQLSEDIEEEKYNKNLLNKIQISLENGDILVLRNMENIYPSLYNLFNQNFTNIGTKRFARIAFAEYNILSLVHEDFRAIILVDEKKIEEKMEDPPFLNRFEKHIFSFEYLMTEEELKISENIINYLDKIFSFNKKKCNINLRKQVPWYNSEEIKGLVYKKCYEYNKEKEKENLIKYEKNIINDIWIIISKLLSQDIMASFIFNENELNINLDIKKYYEENHLNNFNELFNKSKNIFIKGKNTKLIIYTFSKLLESVIKEENIIMTRFGNLKRENIIERIVKSIKYETDFDIIIKDFYEKKEKKILIFEFTENDLDKINQIKFQINNIENEKNKNKFNNIQQEKHIIFIIFLTRHKIENKNKIKIKEEVIEDLISNIDTEYSQYFIDNLRGKKDSNIIETMERSPSFYIEQIFDLKNNYLIKIFQKVFIFLTYQFKSPEIKEEEYIGVINNNLLKNDFLLNLLKEKLINDSGKTLDNFIKNIFSKGIFEKNDVEFIDIIFKVIYDEIYLLIFKFIFKAEKEHLLYPLLNNYNYIKDKKVLIQYIKNYIYKLNFNEIRVVERIKSNQIILYMNLKLPLSKMWFYAIKMFIENNLKEDYLTNENNIRLSDIEEENIEQQMRNYENKKQNILDITKGEILKIEGLKDIIKSDNKEYLKILYQDFMNLYLIQKFNKNLLLGMQFLDILIQLKLNINQKDNYSFINNKNNISLQDSFFNLNVNQEENSININIKYDIDSLSKILLFLICYNEEIYLILEIFFTLSKYLENFFNEWKNLIIKKEINYEINNNTPEYTREINEAFFIMFESLIKCIFTYKNYYKMQEDNFFDFLESIKKILNDAKQIYLKLYLPSKEIYSLEILTNIFISIDSCKKKKKNK